MSGKASRFSCCGQEHGRRTRAGGAPRGGKDCFGSCRAGQYSSHGGYGRRVIVPAAVHLCTEPLVKSKGGCEVNGLYGLRAHVGKPHHAFEHEARSRARARSRAKLSKSELGSRNHAVVHKSQTRPLTPACTAIGYCVHKLAAFIAHSKP